MIVRFEPDSDLLVRHDGIPYVKRATGRLLGVPNPWNTQTPRSCTLAPELPCLKKQGRPVSRSAQTVE
jgi:hypothetical protein